MFLYFQWQWRGSHNGRSNHHRQQHRQSHHTDSVSDKKVTQDLTHVSTESNQSREQEEITGHQHCWEPEVGQSLSCGYENSLHIGTTTLVQLTWGTEGCLCDWLVSVWNLKIFFFCMLRIKKRKKLSDMSLHTRKSTICICETKGADQLYCTADQRSFVFAALTVQFLLYVTPKFQASSLLL